MFEYCFFITEESGATWALTLNTDKTNNAKIIPCVKLEFFIQNRGHDSPGRIQSAFQSASRQNRANALKKS